MYIKTLFSFEGPHIYRTLQKPFKRTPVLSIRPIQRILRAWKRKVLICACDTFRAGAVEQLKTHSRCFQFAYTLNLNPIPKNEVSIFYGKGLTMY